MIVFSMGRVGSHHVRDWLRVNGHPEAFVLHAACLDDGHLLPDAPRYDPTLPPEGVSSERAAVAERLRHGDGVEAVVPVRNPVYRAVSAWTEFAKRRRPIETYAHLDSADGWWARQPERWQGTPLPCEPGWWEGRHRLLLYRVEDGNLGELFGVKGDLPWKERRPLEVTEEFRRRIMAGRTGSLFYSPRCAS